MIVPEGMDELIKDRGKGYVVLVDMDGNEVTSRVRFKVNSKKDIVIGPTSNVAVRYQVLSLSGKVAIENNIIYRLRDIEVPTGDNLYLDGGIVLK